MRRRFAGVVAALVLAMGWSVLATSAHAQLSGYTFTVLADNGPGSPFQSFYVPMMNARGEVVFAADLRSGGGRNLPVGRIAAGAGDRVRGSGPPPPDPRSVQSLFPAPSPIPPPAQRAHSQGGRTLARGRPARQGQNGPGRTREDEEPVRLISRPAPEPAVTGEESRAALPWADGPLGWRAALTAECGFHAARRLHRLVWAAATLERAPAATDRSEPEPAGDALPLTAIERRWVPSPRS